MFVCDVLFCKQKTAYERRISDWSSDGCSSDLAPQRIARERIDEIEPVEDRGAVGERARQIVGEQPRARRGDGAVDGAEQAALARPGHRADEFEAFAHRTSVG